MRYKKKEQITKQCKFCGGDFSTGIIRQKYCSKECNQADKNKMRSDITPSWQKNIPTSLLSQASEFVVLLDLIKKGYEPFRPVRSKMPFNILLEVDGKMIKIEVKTAHNINGKYVTTKRGKYDVLAKVVHEENLIIYEPDIIKNRFRE